MIHEDVIENNSFFSNAFVIMLCILCLNLKPCLEIVTKEEIMRCWSVRCIVGLLPVGVSLSEHAACRSASLVLVFSLLCCFLIIRPFETFFTAAGHVPSAQFLNSQAYLGCITFLLLYNWCVYDWVSRGWEICTTHRRTRTHIFTSILIEFYNSM